MNRVVIINQDSGYLMIDIANSLCSAGIDVTLVTGRLIERNHPLRNAIKKEMIFKYSRSNNLTRFFSWIIAFLQILFLLKTRHRKDHLILVSNPPLTIFLPLFCRNDFSLMIFDVYPDALVNSGLLKKDSLMVRQWSKFAKKTCEKASNIFTLSEGMASKLKTYTGARKITVTPLWSDNDLFKQIPKNSNPFVFKNNLAGKFIVLYSGNLGKTHNVDIIPEIAKLIQDPEIVFLIIGKGEQEAWIKRKISENNLKNCLVLPLQPVSEIQYSFASADIGIVSQGSGISGLSIPSKTYNYISAGLPLLCIAENDSELNSMVNKYNNGRCFGAARLDEIASFILELKQNEGLNQLYRLNSLKASEDFTSRNSESIISELLKSISN